MVISCGGYKRLAGETVTAGATVVPEPVRLTAWAPASSVMLRDPVAEPEAVGVNDTRMVQAAPGAMAAPQLFV